MYITFDFNFYDIISVFAIFTLNSDVVYGAFGDTRFNFEFFYTLVYTSIELCSHFSVKFYHSASV